jgi:hypothetical protein
MDWAAWGPTIVAIVTAIFIAGQVTGRIKDQEKTLAHHDNRLDGHDLKLDAHSQSITRMESWTEGYNAGSSRK